MYSGEEGLGWGGVLSAFGEQEVVRLALRVGGWVVAHCVGAHLTPCALGGVEAGLGVGGVLHAVKKWCA